MAIPMHGGTWSEQGAGGPGDTPPAGVSVEQWARAVAVQALATALPQTSRSDGYVDTRAFILRADDLANFILQGRAR